MTGYGWSKSESFLTSKGIGTSKLYIVTSNNRRRIVFYGNKRLLRIIYD
jgi:hypothetical protein